MAHSNNEWLEQYELKAPDYDYIERDYVGMADASFPPARYTKKGDTWVPKKIKHRLFGKKNVRLMFIGDITCFEKQFDEARNGDDYDFSFEFDKVRPIFAQADLVVGNLETMIFPDAPYRTEKYVSEQNFHCNAPIEFLDAIRKAGVDVLTNANNHDMDTGAVGIGETIDRVEKFGFIQTGTFKSDKKRYEIINVQGFKVAIVAFATEHNNKRCNLTKEGVEFLLNDYSREKAEAIINEARADGAELVFVCIHWGKENKLVNNSEQEAIAEEMVELGYDCIIGSHPHVLQPFTKMYDENAKEVPVFYSMGNFLSHNANNPKARSVIACIDIVRTGSRVDLEASYIPIYTSNNYGSKKYVVLPINAHALDPRNIRKKQQIAEIMGEEIKMTTGVMYHECIEKPDLSAAGAKKDAKPNLAKVKEFPISYDDGKFVYTVNKKAVTLDGISADCATSSYSVPSKVLGLPVTELAPGAFRGNPNMKKINFSMSLSEISREACRDCLVLEGFQLGSKITTICPEAFAGCIRLSAATMRTKVQRIESGAFRGCTALRSVKIPANVTFIADDAFEGCDKATFYCEADSYAMYYAQAHGFKVVVMELE